MTTTIHRVLMIGGDARYREVVQSFAKADFQVIAVGWEKFAFSLHNVTHNRLANIDFSTIDSIILPVSGVNDQGVVELSPYADTELVLTEEMLSKTKETCIIYTGVANAYLKQMVMNSSRSLVTLFDRDDVAILNSIPTAEGTLHIAMEHTDETIHDSHVLVLGFGRVGMSVARLFAAVGAHVTVCVRQSKDRARLKEMGMSGIYFDEIYEVIDQFQIVINTVPYLVLDDKLIEKMGSDSLIIDLASSPGGTDFTTAHNKGIKAIHALGIPGKVAPKTAGKIIADVLIDLMGNYIK